jgi:hypothetical protein
LVPLFRFPVLPDLQQLGTAAARIEAHFLSLGKDRRETA